MLFLMSLKGDQSSCKRILLVFGLLFLLSSVLSSQVEIDKFIFSNIGSHFGGNRSFNISFAIQKYKNNHSIGFDYYYNINGVERALDKTRLSFATTYKYGRELSVSDDFHVYVSGILKYSRMHLHQIDGLTGDAWYNQDRIYERSIRKCSLIPMLEFYHTRNKLFYGMQSGLGVAYIFDVQQTLIGKYDANNNTFGVSENNYWIDLSAFYEHGFYRNRYAFELMPAFYLNIFIGYKF